MSNNSISIDTKIWGPYAWYFLHILSFTYPRNWDILKNISNYYVYFFESLKYLLPCAVCRHHYLLLITKYPFINNSNTRGKAITWILRMHNDVNNKLGYKLYTKNEIIGLYFTKMGQLKLDHNKLFKFIHFITISCNTPIQIQQYKIFIKTIFHLFPCQHCRNNLKLLLNDDFISKIQTLDDLTKEYNIFFPKWIKNHPNYLYQTSSSKLIMTQMFINLKNKYKFTVSKSKSKSLLKKDNMEILRNIYIRPDMNYSLKIDIDSFILDGEIKLSIYGVISINSINSINSDNIKNKQIEIYSDNLKINQNIEIELKKHHFSQIIIKFKFINYKKDNNLIINDILISSI